MKKSNNKMQKKKKVKSKKAKKAQSKPVEEAKQPEKPKVEPKVERPVLGKEDVHPTSPPPEPVAPGADDKFADLTSCSCHAQKEDVDILFQCPKCGVTWCNFCRKTLTACGVCETQGVRAK